MAALIALALGTFALGAAAGITSVVSVAVRREDKNLTLTCDAPDPITLAGRRLTGAYARAPRRTSAAHQRAASA
jgi:hypothetical protein